jgi:hypothetical protein
MSRELDTVKENAETLEWDVKGPGVVEERFVRCAKEGGG